MTETTTHSPQETFGRRLEGKRILITGTGGGQGAAAQRLFCQHGAHVIGCDVTPGAAAATAAELSEQGFHAEGHDVDLADPQAAKTWVETSIETLGGIDVLYNNASAPAIAPFHEMTLDQWRFTMVNELEILFTVTSAAWPQLMKTGGSVLNASSGNASMGVAPMGFAAHAAAKAGVLGLTRQLAAEGAQYGIRVNAVTPGFVESPGTSGMPQEIKDYFSQRINLLPGAIQPVDIAYCALFLASDESRMVSGSEYIVDSGTNGARPA